MKNAVLRRLRSEDGFTMLELIISLAVLCVISLVLVRLFLASANVEHKATDSDRALYVAQGFIEGFKAGADELKEGENVFYFSEDWLPSGPDGRFRADISLTDGGGGLWEIAVMVVRTEPYPMESGGEYELCSLSAKEFRWEDLYGGEDFYGQNP